MSTKSTLSTCSSPASLPAPLAPAVPSVKLLAAAATPSPVPPRPASITTKEWVIPPLPKPGRKPATDTPPTKRKAQNRAAQRAFRERRAARVGELEEQIKQIEEESDKREAALKQHIETISGQLEQCKFEIAWWKKRCQTLENTVAEEKQANEELMKRVQAAEQAHITLDSGVPCENCSSTRCQCIEEAFGFPTSPAAQNDELPKRPRSPHQADASKRQRSDIRVKMEADELETDFTSLFSTNRERKVRIETSVSPSRMIDPCGFCQDGTPCMCAEMAAEAENNPHINTSSDTNNRLAIQSLSQFTPPPSDGDVRSEPLPSGSNSIISNNSIKANPCINGPGTCAQCQADPKSTLFCKSLAASRANIANATGAGSNAGCCGGRGSEGGCCQSRPLTRNAGRNRNEGQRNDDITCSPSTQQQQQPITLSCADTYTALSRHPNFSRATDDLNNWLPHLHTLPNPQGFSLPNYTGRPAMEVEAASVMGVLKYFDRRFAD
ncbi:uncharacterized protein PADG_07492 [Paracoccidioides brasiliensis Pb18]|uniref:BZIP domain-containing protein n=1 Tax=Paracoccidioides brasiliensis (strain Pb18) TaxID=502780 RepID=C1GJQ6_PARBD|nr:uncharacterized protein PADG_07492 [Paracoccidioides brasiliensis Pb18]EEH42672.1 hypothetical protein PADG_07492 [Paracoccidioides brasiliensis Pb18]